MKKTLQLSFLVLLVIFLFNAHVFPQKVVLSSGGSVSNSAGSVSFSIGQTFCATATGSFGTFSEGIQRPYEITVPTELKGAQKIFLTCSVAPNPVTDFLELSIDEKDTNGYSFRLYDLKGKMLTEGNASLNKTTINMIGVSSGVYMLKVIQNNQEIKVFKIVKN